MSSIPTNPSSALPKVQIVPGSTENSATFLLNGEDHTLGNALRYVLMRHKQTIFCGYSMPHPSEAVVNIRLQTQKGSSSSTDRNGDSAMEVFREGAQSLISISNLIGSAFDKALDAVDSHEPSLMNIGDEEAQVGTTKKKKGVTKR